MIVVYAGDDAPEREDFNPQDPPFENSLATCLAQYYTDEQRNKHGLRTSFIEPKASKRTWCLRQRVPVND